MSLEQPLLDESGISSRTSDEDIEFDKKPPHFSTRGRNSPRRLRRSLILTLAQGIGLTALVLQSVVLWKLWRQSGHAEALGEINGLVPSGTYCTSILV
jgi:cytoskeletal protein RodZ